MALRFETMVGHYRLVVSDELRDFIEGAFVAPAPEPERAQVREGALAEANDAQLELHPDGAIVSRTSSEQFYRVVVQPPVDAVEELRFSKPDGAPVVLRFIDVDTLQAEQPKKPLATFRRAR